MLDISGGFCGITVPGVITPGWFSELSALAKSAVDIPVMVTGGITKAEEAVSLFTRGVADLVGVGRAMLKKADWAEEALGD